MAVEDLERIAQLQKKIAPEMTALLEERYHILKHIRYHQPIGRRLLASQLALSESSVRSGVKVLKDSGLVELSGLGMAATPAGMAMVAELSAYVDALHELEKLESYLAKALDVRVVKIVAGDSTADASVRGELGRVTSQLLFELVADRMIVAVSGGSTMAAVAEAIDWTRPGVTVVPTRGGLGERVERQANSVAAVMAGKLGGQYRLLHIPEVLGDEALEALRAADPSIGEIESLIKRADVLLHGIGRADVMLRRRNHTPEVTAHIAKRGVGEMLGHYFSADGACIYSYCTKGFRLNDLAGIGRRVAVAGGAEKAEAILAVTRAGSKDVLVMDEAAAEAVQTIIESEVSQKNF